MIHKIDRFVHVCIFEIQRQRSATYLHNLINAFDFRFPFGLISHVRFISLAILIFLYHTNYLNICKFKKKVKIYENKNILDPDQAPQKGENLYWSKLFESFTIIGVIS